MKQFKLFILILFLISFAYTNKIKKVFAEQSSFALVAPVVDLEPNNTIGKAIIIEENLTTASSPQYKSSYVGGTIQSSDDVDYYALNVYYNASIGLHLTMMDSSMIYALQYNFQIIKVKNITLPNLIDSDRVIIHTSSTSGTNDYYTFSAEPGTYYIKIYAQNCSSTKYSYKLNYQVTPTTRTSYNIEEYAQNNPNSYIYWESDFSYANIRNYIEPNDYVLYDSTNYQNHTNHPVANEFMSLGIIPTFDVYFWGKNLRDILEEKINKVIDDINLALKNIQQIDRITSEFTNFGSTANLVLSFFISNSKVGTVTVTVGSIIFLIFPLIINTNSAITKVELLDFYQDLRDSIKDYDGTLDDNNIYIISHALELECDLEYGKYSYKLRSVIDMYNSRYTADFRYNTTMVYDIKQFDSNNDGVYTNFYGKIYFENAYEKINDFYGSNLI